MLIQNKMCNKMIPKFLQNNPSPWFFSIEWSLLRKTIFFYEKTLKIFFKNFHVFCFFSEFKIHRRAATGLVLVFWPSFSFRELKAGVSRAARLQSWPSIGDKINMTAEQKIDGGDFLLYPKSKGAAMTTQWKNEHVCLSVCLSLSVSLCLCLCLSLTLRQLGQFYWKVARKILISWAQRNILHHSFLHEKNITSSRIEPQPNWPQSPTLPQSHGWFCTFNVLRTNQF